MTGGMVTHTDPGHAIDEIARALIRPVVTVMFAAAFIWFTYIEMVSGEVFAAIAGMVIAFWFSSRNQDKQDEKSAQLQTSIINKLPSVEHVPTIPAVR